LLRNTDLNGIYTLDPHTGSLVQIDTSVNFEVNNYMYLGLVCDNWRGFLILGNTSDYLNIDTK